MVKRKVVRGQIDDSVLRNHAVPKEDWSLDNRYPNLTLKITGNSSSRKTKYPLLECVDIHMLMHIQKYTHIVT